LSSVLDVGGQAAEAAGPLALDSGNPRLYVAECRRRELIHTLATLFGGGDQPCVGQDLEMLGGGLAALWAAVLLATGAPGKRLTLPNARVLIHQPHGGAQGRASDMAIQIEEMQYAHRELERVEVIGPGYR
jgi:hypothetical protein